MQQRRRVLRTCDPDEEAEASGLGQAFRDEKPPDVGCPWVNGLVDQRWRPPEVGQVPYCNVLWVRQVFVERG